MSFSNIIAKASQTVKKYIKVRWISATTVWVHNRRIDLTRLTYCPNWTTRDSAGEAFNFVAGLREEQAEKVTVLDSRINEIDNQIATLTLLREESARQRVQAKAKEDTLINVLDKIKVVMEEVEPKTWVGNSVTNEYVEVPNIDLEDYLADNSSLSVVDTVLFRNVNNGKTKSFPAALKDRFVIENLDWQLVKTMVVEMPNLPMKAVLAA
ncbi:hypothetical protein [Spirosoma terrae]|uniref:Uncharacterized protein n=1 Tax=Spirosoma terrae TaxID=1968276 RepID=A0A6L9LGK9_9BACT|nr:hypothetical protein [Spirosoma terrae]NDU95779.1 hypothetical protein [Spirosoma terrae]